MRSAAPTSEKRCSKEARAERELGNLARARSAAERASISLNNGLGPGHALSQLAVQLQAELQ